MHIIIIEDEGPIAKYIERLCQNILGNKIDTIRTFNTIEHALSFLQDHRIDLCLLDLNLNGENAYELLQFVASAPFQTIIISAYTDLAIDAFKYGVLDFIAKPFNKERLELAFDRYFERVGVKK